MEPAGNLSYKNQGVVRTKYPKHLFNAGTHRKHLCKMCPSGFDSETEVEMHRVLSHRGKLIRGFNRGSGCTVCQTPFSEKDIHEHLEKKHLFIDNNHSKIQRPVYVCDECHMLFFNPKSLIAHFNHRHVMIDSIKINCPVCGKLSRWSSIIQHMDNSHTRSLKFCPICLEKQDRIGFIPTHVNVAHPVKHKCNFCRYRASSAKQLDHHLLDAHEKKAASGATITSQSVIRYFTRLREGKVRLSKMQFPDRGINIQDMAAICMLCQTVVYSTEAMKKHLATHAHNELPPLSDRPSTFHAMALQREPQKKVRVCDCGATFTTEVLYKHHVFKMHTLPAAKAESIEIEICDDNKRAYLSSQESKYTSEQAIVVDESDEEVEIEVVMADGDVEVADGDVEVADGDVEVADGDVEVADGDVEVIPGPAIAGEVGAIAVQPLTEYIEIEEEELAS